MTRFSRLCGLLLLLTASAGLLAEPTSPAEKGAPSAAAAAGPAKAEEPGRGGAKAVAKRAVADTIFPPVMAQDILLEDPSWAQLRPDEQIEAIRRRVESTGKDATAQGRLQLTIAYIYDQKKGEKLVAAAEYARLQRYAVDARSRYEFAGQALLRASALFYDESKARDNKDAKKQAHRALDGIVMAEQRSGGTLKLWQNQSGVWTQVDDPYKYALQKIDDISRDQIVYKVIDVLVHLTGNVSGLSHVLALLLLALGLNAATFPLSRMSYRSMREMQRVQPLLKELQARYKDDPQRQQAEMMKVYREHGVNPLAGCLPMLIQMPMFIFVYQGIRAYTFHFHGASFLWIQSLAKPDLPLLLCYGLSMYVTQKLMMASQPPADPQQAQMQRTMSYMMPLMFTFMMYSWNLPSAFYFYWLAFNILSTAATFINKATMPPMTTPVLAVSTPGSDSAAEGGAKQSALKMNRTAGRAGSKGKKRGKR
ncbi:MAG: membrane protein insertase YidC [Armatimonadetes bacterium]|nr:membrane protein insertase YidC [Armatimonadota bacterium]